MVDIFTNRFSGQNCFHLERLSLFFNFFFLKYQNIWLRSPFEQDDCLMNPGSATVKTGENCAYSDTRENQTEDNVFTKSVSFIYRSIFV